MSAYPVTALAFILFCLAAAGFLTTGNLVRMLMFLELMLNAANIVLVALGGDTLRQGVPLV